jgi:integrase/recombinase XerD
MQPRIEEFLNSLQVEKGYSNNTIVAYRNDLNQFADYLAGQLHRESWDHVQQDDLVSYVNALRYDREYASATIARKVAAAKSFFHYLVNRGEIADNPCADLDSPKVRKYLPTSISKEEVDLLLKAPTKGNSARCVRDSALLEILYATGMRVSEVVALDIQDVDLENACVHCTNKSSRAKERRIPLYARAVDSLRIYVDKSRPKLRRAEEETALFLNHRGQRLTRQGLWLIIKKYVEEVGIEPSVTPHTLRHSFATHLLNGGAKVREVQELLGHANVSTTQVYKHANLDDHLRSAYDEAHPRAR